MTADTPPENASDGQQDHVSGSAAPAENPSEPIRFVDEMSGVDEDDYDDDATTTQARSADEDEPHEVAAMYDNLGGLLLGLTYGTPVLDCSCGYSTPTLGAEVGWSVGIAHPLVDQVLVVLLADLGPRLACLKWPIPTRAVESRLPRDLATATPTRFTARCPVCHRRQPLVCTRTGHVYAAHRSGSQECSGSGAIQ